MSFHCGARASDCRRPRGDRDGPAGVRRRFQDGAGLSRFNAVVMSLCRWAGGSTRVATFRLARPLCIRTWRARDGTRRKRRTVAGE
jgi:hypothetical protein